MDTSRKVREIGVSNTYTMTTPKNRIAIGAATTVGPRNHSRLHGEQGWRKTEQKLSGARLTNVEQMTGARAMARSRGGRK